MKGVASFCSSSLVIEESSLLATLSLSGRSYSGISGSGTTSIEELLVTDDEEVSSEDGVDVSVDRDISEEMGVGSFDSLLCVVSDTIG